MTSEPRTAPFVKFSVWGGVVAIALWMLSVSFPDEASAVLLVMVTSGIAISVFRRYSDDKEFVTNLFLAALVVRLAFGMFVYVFGYQTFFGSDSSTYDAHGSIIYQQWIGLVASDDPFYLWAASTARPGWGMNYLTAAIYLLTGKSYLAAQSFCAVIGASTAPMVYFCAKKLFTNSSPRSLPSPEAVAAS